MNHAFLRWALVALLAAALATGARAQQDPMYSMYMWNMMALDPAYAGSADVLNITALSRMQWTGINGAPVTNSLSGHAPIDRGHLGVGLTAVNDRIGRTNTTSAFADIAYRMRLTKHTRFALGLKGGINQASVRNTQVENTAEGDPTFAQDLAGRVSPNFGFGMYLWSRNGYIGLSVPKLMRSHLSVVKDNGSVGFMEESMHAFLTAGWVFTLGPQVKFKPAVMVKAAEGAPVSPDISGTFYIRDHLDLGMAYRNGDSFSALFGIRLSDQWRAGYAYDFGLSKLAVRSGGSHEIMLGYAPVFNRERIRSPRYF